MTTRRRHADHPLLAWGELSRRQSEMLLAAGQVIPIRLTRMAAAGPRPGRRDRREFHRMGAEKVQAGMQSWLAVAMELQRMQMQWLAQAWQQWMRAGSVLAGAALTPIHATATANARRLGRVTRSSGKGHR